MLTMTFKREKLNTKYEPNSPTAMSSDNVSLSNNINSEQIQSEAKTESKPYANYT
jgi:hypothetical protein